MNIPSGSITSTTNDLDEDVTYVASERFGSHGKVEIDLWKLHPQNVVTFFFEIRLNADLDDKQQTDELNVPTTTILANTLTDNPCSPQIVSLRFIAEARKIAAITRAGDVITVSVEEEGTPVRKSKVYKTF